MGNDHITTVVEVDFEYVPVEPKEPGIIISKTRNKGHFDLFHIKLSFCHYLSLHRQEPRLPILIRSLHQTACCRRRHLLSGTKPTRRFLSSFCSCVQTSSSSGDAYPIPDFIRFAQDLDGEFVGPNPYRVVELNVNIMLLSQLTIFSSCGSNTVLSDDEPAIVDKHPALNRVRRRRDEYDDDDDPAAEEFMGGLALKKRRREADSCRICLEDIDYAGDHNCAAAGMAALPCGHVCHQNCIVNWLHAYVTATYIYICPLCRYPMPAALSWP